jgi:hypothetical protein
MVIFFIDCNSIAGTESHKKPCFVPVLTVPAFFYRVGAKVMPFAVLVLWTLNSSLFLILNFGFSVSGKAAYTVRPSLYTHWKLDPPLIGRLAFLSVNTNKG